MLNKITELWRSEGSRERYLGLIGKLFVELGSCVMLAIVIYMPLAAVDWYFGVFDLLSDPWAVLTMIGLISAYLGNLVFCKVITRDMSDLDRRLNELLSDEEGGETPADESEGSSVQATSREEPKG